MKLDPRERRHSKQHLGLDHEVTTDFRSPLSCDNFYITLFGVDDGDYGYCQLFIIL